MAEELINRVAQSGLVTFKPESLFPDPEPVGFDLADYLFKGLVLREKDFRAALKAIDWSDYDGQTLAVHCSVDAIIPVWAYMLISVYAEPHAARILQAKPSDAITQLMLEAVAKLDVESFKGARVVVKGCAAREIAPAVYQELATRLRPHVKSLMYGEPCSTVPLYKSS